MSGKVFPDPAALAKEAYPDPGPVADRDRFVFAAGVFEDRARVAAHVVALAKAARCSAKAFRADGKDRDALKAGGAAKALEALAKSLKA